MAVYSNPANWIKVGRKPTAAEFNKYLRDNLLSLYEAEYGQVLLARVNLAGGMPQTKTVTLLRDYINLVLVTWIEILPTGTGNGAVDMQWNGVHVAFKNYTYNAVEKQQVGPLVAVIGSAGGGSATNQITWANSALSSTDANCRVDAIALGF